MPITNGFKFKMRPPQIRNLKFPGIAVSRFVESHLITSHGCRRKGSVFVPELRGSACTVTGFYGSADDMLGGLPRK